MILFIVHYEMKNIILYEKKLKITENIHFNNVIYNSILSYFIAIF